MTYGHDYVPTQVAFQVRKDETTNVSIKLEKGQRIVFKPKMDSEGAGAVAIGFEIRTPDGKPVLRDTMGQRWGDIPTHTAPSSSEQAAITVKPGHLSDQAGAVLGDAWSFRVNPKLTGYSGKVTVVSGKDTVIEVPVSK